MGRTSQERMTGMTYAQRIARGRGRASIRAVERAEALKKRVGNFMYQLRMWSDMIRRRKHPSTFTEAP